MSRWVGLPLPAELRAVIWRHLDAYGICQAMAVSASWQRMFHRSDQQLWEALCVSAMPLVAGACVGTECCWAGLFRALTRCPKKVGVPPTVETTVDRSRFLLVAVVNERHAGIVDHSGAWLPTSDVVLDGPVTRVSCGENMDFIVPRNLSLRIVCVDRITWRSAQFIHDTSMIRAEVVSCSHQTAKSFTQSGDLISYGRETSRFLGFVNVRAVDGGTLRLVAAGVDTVVGDDLGDPTPVELWRLCNHPLPCLHFHQSSSAQHQHLE